MSMIFSYRVSDSLSTLVVSTCTSALNTLLSRSVMFVRWLSYGK